MNIRDVGKTAVIDIAQDAITTAELEKIEKLLKTKASVNRVAINLSNVRGKNEVYLFNVTDNQIIIAGSDKRGTIYGLFHLSELLGVSPLVDWANVFPAKKGSSSN